MAFKTVGFVFLGFTTLPFSIIQVKPGRCYVVCSSKITYLIFYIEASQVKQCTQLSCDLLFIHH